MKLSDIYFRQNQCIYDLIIDFIHSSIPNSAYFRKAYIPRNNFENDVVYTASSFVSLDFRTGRLDKLAHYPHSSGCISSNENWTLCKSHTRSWNDSQFVRITLCNLSKNMTIVMCFLILLILEHGFQRYICHCARTISHNSF